MAQIKQIFILMLAFFFYSCSNTGVYPYAIKDFSQKLQPHLIRIVAKGIVMTSDSGLEHIATDADLVRLGRSEHPILRAAAFREMLQRKSFNDFDILMEHLDDTALVFTDAGEFGLWDRTVSDDILQTAEWQTQEAKDKTVEQVLSKHNYLRSAYIILNSLKPQEKYYPFIKEMASRPRRLDYYDGSELGFGDIEYALYGLAGFRKKKDVQIIKSKMMKHIWELSDLSFRLMTEFPDTAYLDVLATYHRRQFYRFSGYRPHGFTGYPADKADPEDFIQAVVVQQNERSAALLDSMLISLSKFTWMPDRENIREEVISAIWEHPCAAYAKLRQKNRPKTTENLEPPLPVQEDSTEVDRTRRTLRWYN